MQFNAKISDNNYVQFPKFKKLIKSDQINL
jgi:hypothetical protein